MQSAIANRTSAKCVFRNKVKVDRAGRLCITHSAQTEKSSVATKMAATSVKDRARAAVLGGFLADAATMGLHWIYDTTKLKGLLDASGKTATPEFFSPPSCPFYKAEDGELSPYGAECYPVLKYFAEHDSIDGDSFSQALYSQYKAYTGYLNHSSKGLVARVEAGQKWPQTGDPEDAQANAFVKVPPIVARYAGKPELLGAVETAVRAQQNNDKAVQAGLAAARILEKVVLGSSVASALSWAASEPSLQPAATEVVGAVLAVQGQAFEASVKQFGASCGLPGSLQSSLAGVMAYDNYMAGVRANIVAGGDNCSRSILVGALLAAEYGLGEASQWGSKMRQFSEVQELTEKLLNRS